MFGLSKYLIAGLAAVILTLCVSVWWLKVSNDKLSVRNASLSRSVTALESQAAHARLARDVEEARADKQARETLALKAQVSTILNGGIPDALLHPDLADLLNGGNVQQR